MPYATVIDTVSDFVTFLREMWNTVLLPVLRFLTTGLYDLLPSWLATVIYTCAVAVALLAIKRLFIS